MQNGRVVPSNTQVSTELDGQLAWQVQLQWFSFIGVLEIRLRWIAALVVLIATWFANSILRIPLPTWPLYAIGACMLAYNALFWFYLRRRFAYLRPDSGYDYDSPMRFYWRGLEREGISEAASFERFVKLQLGLDWLAMVLLVHFSGGVASPLLFYFVFHLIMASILLSRRDCYWFATLAAFAVGLLVLLEYWGVIPHVSLGFTSVSLHQNLVFVGAVLFFFTTSLYMSVYLATTLTRNLRRRDEELLHLQQQLSEAYLFIHTVYSVTRTASSSLRLEEVLNVIAQSAVEAMQVKACAIMLTGDRYPLVETLAASGLSDEYLGAGPVDIEKSRYLHETLSKGRPVIVADISHERKLQYPDLMRAEGIRSILCVPLTIRGRAEGVICVYSAEADQFIQSDAEFLTTLSSAGATAMENARAYEALEMADRAKSDFVRMLTHEFRSPLSAVQSMLRLLEIGVVGPVTDKQRDLIERSKRRIAVLLAMVNDLLELAAGKMEMLQGVKQEVNFSEIIARVSELMQPRAEEKGIEYRVEIAEDPLILLGFEDGLERLVMNLVSNAVKYTLPDGSTTIRAWSEEGKIKLEVSDTGIGIPEDALPRIFTEFYRAKNAKDVAKDGTGLGLVLVKDVVEQHGGQISVKSVVDQGSTFTVTLPQS